MPDLIDSKTDNEQLSAAPPMADSDSLTNSFTSPATPLRADQVSRGDWLQVKTPAALGEMLDNDGATDGLPFMPEMLEFCGQRFQVSHFANKVCANVGTVEIRELQNVVVLKMNRCDGCFHGGCQMACELLWKLDWLEQAPAESDSTSAWARQAASLLRCISASTLLTAKPTGRLGARLSVSS